MADEQGAPDEGARHQVQEINGLKFIRSGGHWLPASGSWPCQHAADPKSPEALVSFLYRLLRDGALSAADVENHASQAALGGQNPVVFTNPHIEAYARSLAGLLLRPVVDDMKVADENRSDQLEDRRTIAIIVRDGCAEGVSQMQARADADYVIEVNPMASDDYQYKLTKDREGLHDLVVVR